jgi:hypothetical protein
MRMSILRRSRVARSRTPSTADSTMPATFTGVSFSSSAPASMVMRSRMSSMMASSVEEDDRMSLRYSRCLRVRSLAGGCIISSVKPMMLVSGVRSS